MKKTRPEDFYGKTIRSLRIDRGHQMVDGSAPDALVMMFTDGSALCVYDDGQACCEDRYMTCDDDLTSLNGQVLVEIVVRTGPTVTTDDGSQETQFVAIVTTRGEITVTNHNEHNGFYGGFEIAFGS